MKILTLRRYTINGEDYPGEDPQLLLSDDEQVISVESGLVGGHPSFVVVTTKLDADLG